MKDIKTSIINENIDECYLNPKDNIINEHYNQLLFKNLPDNLLFYLPLNEIFILVLEEKLVIYDIKISVTENLKILDEIYYLKDIINFFNINDKTNKIENEKIKSEKNRSSNYFLDLNFIDKEQEDKQIKNISISDKFFDHKGYFIIIIEFKNLDIYIIEYNLLYEINNMPKMKLISKSSKTMFIEKNVNNTFNKNEENMVKNTSKTNIKIINDNNRNIFIIYQHKNNFYIYDLIINEISLFGNTYSKENEKSLKFNKISLKNEFIHFDANYCSFSSFNYFEFITVTKNNIIYYYLLEMKYDEELGKKFVQLLAEEMKLDNISNISDIKYFREKSNVYDDLLKERIFFVIKLNQVLIIKYNILKDKNENLRMNICYRYLIDILEFAEEQIYKIFFLHHQYFYSFTRKGKYIENICNLEKLKNNENIETIIIKEKPKYFKISKFIYDIKPFQSENGFFFLVTQYPMRPINMNILYKINYSNLKPINDNFVEGLLISLRQKQKEINIEKENKNYYLYNKRFEFFINKIYKGQSNLIDNIDNKMVIEKKDNNIDEENENKNDDLMNVNSDEYNKCEKQSLIEINKIKKELISYFKKQLEKVIKTDDYLIYLKNQEYKCEFCKELFKEYDKENMFYKCINNDITFSCCISYRPINDNFFWCSYCNLFYSEKIKIFYCVVCDRILSKLDSL